MLELADLHSIMLENEGYSPCRAIVMVMRQGKTNQVGRIEVGACMRNKIVEICPHGLLGLYLFWRWHVDGEAFPDFTSSDRWYPLKLLKTGKDPKKTMSYKVHREAITAALNHVGIRSKAKTHVGRGSGSRMADLGGASESQIRRLGRWNTQAMEKCYLTSLPREAMRTLAGFEPSRGNFFVARASVEPPRVLQSMIFPQVEKWQHAINDGKAEQSIAAGGFLELLQYLRKVILQDAVFLQDFPPHHPVWQHDIFSSDEFMKFKGETRKTIYTMENPADQRLQKAMPILKARLEGAHQDLKTSIDRVSSTVDAIEGNIADILRTLEPLRGGTAILQVKLVSNPANNVAAFPSCSSTVTSEARSDQPSTSHYKMRRGLESVKELWEEWSVGFDGGTPVRELEERYGTKWCDADERRFFNRRRSVLNFVQQLSREAQRDTGVGADVATQLAVHYVDDTRKTRRKTLNWLSKNIALIHDEVKSRLIARISLDQVATSL
ncbi:hypothetical protein F443_01771 [Phytophthora nicotianae P1569]|uniref:Ndc10 domain-containing protein n=2 Tax=Phytophthora nicotianae TaxID=4792 RepID=V9FYS8_PHYNI|nr:hypothetical protein F443_01771 [Phytophthora nicotianae P1569]